MNNKKIGHDIFNNFLHERASQFVENRNYCKT